MRRDKSLTYVSSAELIPPNGDRGWEVQCRQRMIPTHAAISGTEARLAALAEQVGGHADGLGLSGGVKVTTCFA